MSDTTKMTLTKLFHLLSNEDRKKGLKLIILLIFMGIIEAAGIASILPFLALVGNPNIITENQILYSFYLFLDSNLFDMDNISFLVILGILSFIFVLVTTFFRIYCVYIMNKYIETARYHLSINLLKSYLHQPYDFFLNRHSSELTKNMLSEVDFVIIQILRPVVQMASYIFVLISIFLLLMWHNTLIAVTSIVAMGMLYVSVYFLLRPKILKYGDTLVKSNKKRFKAGADTLGGIKNIKMYKCEKIYLDRFSLFSWDFVQSSFRFQVYNQTPKYLLEALAFGGIILLTIFIIVNIPAGSGNIGAVLPVLGLYAFSAYRMQPALTAIYQGVTSLGYGTVAINNLFNEIKKENYNNILHTKKLNRIKPENKISLNSIYFTFKGSEKIIINDLNLTIKVGSCVGIIGGSGAGKTTLLDIMLGLLLPDKGFISIDNQEVKKETIASWQKCLGYIPQNIFLTDNSFAENIAFGVSVNKINYQKVIDCAKIAQIHDFIMGEFSKGYDAKVGERGVRISGGQSQRIGIARALYTNPDVLILDEATSALDPVTEKEVLNSIHNILKDKTIIVVTHKLSTVKYCDSIVLLENGSVKNVGSYNEIKSLNLNYFNQSLK